VCIAVYDSEDHVIDTILSVTSVEILHDRTNRREIKVTVFRQKQCKWQLLLTERRLHPAIRSRSTESQESRRSSAVIDLVPLVVGPAASKA